MIITFQIQIDPLEPREFTRSECQVLLGEMNVFADRVEGRVGEYTRAEMYIDKEVFNGWNI